MKAGALVDARGIVKHFDSRRGFWGRLTGNPGSLVHAVDGLDITINRGQTVGLIGESGCGKSTLGRTILRIHEPTAGEIRFDGTDITQLNQASLKAMRRKQD